MFSKIHGNRHVVLELIRSNRVSAISVVCRRYIHIHCTVTNRSSYRSIVSTLRCNSKRIGLTAHQGIFGSSARNCTTRSIIIKSNGRPYQGDIGISDTSSSLIYVRRVSGSTIRPVYLKSHSVSTNRLRQPKLTYTINNITTTVCCSGAAQQLACIRSKYAIIVGIKVNVRPHPRTIPGLIRRSVLCIIDNKAAIDRLADLEFKSLTTCQVIIKLIRGVIGGGNTLIKREGLFFPISDRRLLRL